MPGRRGGQFAASLAISRATITSRTTVAPTASIHGARTVNVRALGTVESEAEAESSLLADGTAVDRHRPRVLRRRRARPHRRQRPGRHGHARRRGRQVRVRPDRAGRALDAATRSSAGLRTGRDRASGSAPPSTSAAVSRLARAPSSSTSAPTSSRLGRLLVDIQNYLDDATWEVDVGAVGLHRLRQRPHRRLQPRQRGRQLGRRQRGHGRLLAAPRHQHRRPVTRHLRDRDAGGQPAPRPSTRAATSSSPAPSSRRSTPTPGKPAFNTGVNPYVINLTPGGHDEHPQLRRRRHRRRHDHVRRGRQHVRARPGGDLPRARPHRLRPRRRTGFWQSPDADDRRRPRTCR